ncbi:MAG: amidase [Chlorobi bacterium]|nr:amidase [Chlorobiota bacterium]
MKRRSFIRFATLSGAAVTVSPFSSCKTENKKATTKEAKPNDFELNEITVDELQKRMANGTLSAEETTKLYIERIKAIDSSGPKLNSVIELNPDALNIARQLDKERKEGKIRGPLHGIPILIKDNIDTADKMMTTAGALALKGNYAKQDSYVAKKLREAGAVILGKTNLSEWANFRSTHSTSGWSSRGGQTHNPYILSRNPCGSSSGSGASVSANLTALAIGTETNGSIVCPSNANGVVGIKPTVGLVGRSGIIPISETQDTAGPMARTVKDAAILLGALTGTDPNDKRTQESNGNSYSDYTKFLDKDGLKGARLGIARSYFGQVRKENEELEKAIEIMKQQGAVIIDIDERIPAGKGQDAFNVLLYEFKDGLNKYFANIDPALGIRSLKDVIEFNKKHADEAMPYFGQEILEMAEEKGDLNTKEYLEAHSNVLKESREGIDNIIDKHNLDAIVAPTGGPAWTTELIYGDHGGGGSSSAAARAGYPNITVPAGSAYGLPFGLSFFGRAYSEPVLIRIAYAFEQHSKKRIVPEFLNPHNGVV